MSGRQAVSSSAGRRKLGFTAGPFRLKNDASNQTRCHDVKKSFGLHSSVWIATLGLSLQAATYSGIGNSGFGFRSDEAVAGNDVHAQGWNPFLGTAFATYTIVPEPSTLALFGFAGLAALFQACRRR